MKKIAPYILGLLIGAILSVPLIWMPAAVIAAVAGNPGTLQRDANMQSVQVSPTSQLWDNTASAATITNLALTSNVVTITATHNFAVGQRVTIALLTGPTLFADCNGTFVIASVSTTVSFTYAFTHANISTGAATGTATANYLSPVPTGTSQIALTFPAKAIALIIVPTVSVTDCTYSYTTSGGIGGTFHAFTGVSNVISGTGGDVVFIQRGTTTPLDFQFACTK